MTTEYKRRDEGTGGTTTTVDSTARGGGRTDALKSMSYAQGAAALSPSSPALQLQEAPQTAEGQPVYDEEYWHETDTRRANNCYTYAVNDSQGRDPMDRSDPLGYGGNYEGKTVAERVDMLISLAQADGLILEQRVSDGKPAESIPAAPAARKGHYAVALLATPDAVQYHWYRQDADGTWSGKQGRSGIKNTDDSGEVIADLSQADIGSYQWVAYFSVPAGGLDIDE